MQVQSTGWSRERVALVRLCAVQVRGSWELPSSSRIVREETRRLREPDTIRSDVPSPHASAESCGQTVCFQCDMGSLVYRGCRSVSSCLVDIREDGCTRQVSVMLFLPSVRAGSNGLFARLPAVSCCKPGRAKGGGIVRGGRRAAGVEGGVQAAAWCCRWIPSVTCKREMSCECGVEVAPGQSANGLGFSPGTLNEVAVRSK